MINSQLIAVALVSGVTKHTTVIGICLLSPTSSITTDPTVAL